MFTCYLTCAPSNYGVGGKISSNGCNVSCSFFIRSSSFYKRPRDSADVYVFFLTCAPSLYGEGGEISLNGCNVSCSVFYNVKFFL